MSPRRPSTYRDRDTIRRLGVCVPAASRMGRVEAGISCVSDGTSSMELASTPRMERVGESPMPLRDTGWAGHRVIAASLNSPQDQKQQAQIKNTS